MEIIRRFMHILNFAHIFNTFTVMGWHQQVNKLDTCGIILNLRISMIMLDTNLMIYENMLESVGAHDE